ncbi:hypothetical protein HNR38_001196 [Marinobacter oulmenensis]|uniref:Uncharacterized protein n=1 Tax=Marinobacter oulmenensis TaxID=643747 RepID=A0A840U4S2_9GAMM|nr:hypothetical protein [Marinobacter oulmenensis]
MVQGEGVEYSVFEQSVLRVFRYLNEGEGELSPSHYREVLALVDTVLIEFEDGGLNDNDAFLSLLMDRVLAQHSCGRIDIPECTPPLRRGSIGYE